MLGQLSIPVSQSRRHQSLIHLQPCSQPCREQPAWTMTAYGALNSVSKVELQAGTNHYTLGVCLTPSAKLLSQIPLFGIPILCYFASCTPFSKSQLESSLDVTDKLSTGLLLPGPVQTGHGTFKLGHTCLRLPQLPDTRTAGSRPILAAILDCGIFGMNHHHPLRKINTQ